MPRRGGSCRYSTDLTPEGHPPNARPACQLHGQKLTQVEGSILPHRLHLAWRLHSLVSPEGPQVLPRVAAEESLLKGAP